MDLEDKKQNKTRLLRATLIVFSLYPLVVMSALFMASERVREMANGATTVVRFGLLDLFNIQKTVTNSGGFVLEYNMQSGHVYLMSILLATLIAYILFKKYKQRL